MTGNAKRKKIQAAAAKLPPASRARLKQDSLDHGRIVGPQTAQWISDAVRVAHAVASGNTDLIPVFWIRLYGVLADLRAFADSQHATLTSMGAPPGPLPAVLTELQNLANVFNADELVYIQYRRHVECHPFQQAYRLRLTGGGLVDSVEHKLLQGELSVEETTKAIRRVLAAFRVKEVLIAKAFAHRAHSALQRLHEKALPWCGPGT